MIFGQGQELVPAGVRRVRIAGKATPVVAVPTPEFALLLFRIVSSIVYRAKNESDAEIF